MIGAIARAHGDHPFLCGRLRSYQRTALDDIAACGTPACGFHAQACDHCPSTRLVPNTCGHRSCPHCQGGSRAAWVEARERELLPGIGFFHVVFTVPPAIARLAMIWPVVVLGALLRASADALLLLCRDPRHLGAEVGLVEVLHTWTRDLRWHPHVHQIVTAGGWDSRNGCWVDARRHGPARTAFLLPVAVLREAFQQRLVALLLEAYERGAFDSDERPAFPELASLADFRRHLGAITRKRFCIRIEPPFAGAETLLKYLGAYVNRVALRPERIQTHDPAANGGAGQVTWTWASNADPKRQQTRTQTGVDFLATFARHILPPRLVRIRFRGLWCTAHRATKLEQARAWLLLHRPAPPPPPPQPPPDPSLALTTDASAKGVTEKDRCPVCGVGTYRRIPGPCPRPNRAERRRILDQIRDDERAQAPHEDRATA